MNKYIYYTLAFLMTYSSFHAMVTDDTTAEYPIFIKIGATCPCKSGAIKFDGKNFSIQKNGSNTEVKPHNICRILKTFSKEQLQKFQDMGNYIQITQFTDGEYALQANARGLGGCNPQWFYETGCYGYEYPETIVTPAVARLLPQHSRATNIDPNTTNSTTTNSPQVIQRTPDTLQTETHCNTDTGHSNTK